MKPKIYDGLPVWRKFCASIGQPRSRASAIRESERNKAIKPAPAPKPCRAVVLIQDSSLASTAERAAHASNRRIRNWVAARPTMLRVARGDYESIDNGQYSRFYKYTHWTYSPLYTSYAIMGANGCAILYRAGWADDMYSRCIKAPAGMRWEHDANGLLLRRLSDGMDYHPAAPDLRAKAFAATIRAAMAHNYVQRRAARLAARDTARVEKLYQADLATTRVTLHDSRRAGNCVEGSLSFAERKLGIGRAEILASAHLFAVPAQRLLKVANGDAHRVNAAIRAAWTRETTVSI